MDYRWSTAVCQHASQKLMSDEDSTDYQTAEKLSPLRVIQIRLTVASLLLDSV